MIQYLPKEALAPFFSKLFNLLFNRLSSSKTTKYIKSLLVFFSLFAIRYSTSELITVIDAAQPKLFAMVIERLIVPEIQRVSGTLERKICAVGLTRLLCDTPECFTGMDFKMCKSFNNRFIDFILKRRCLQFVLESIVEFSGQSV